MGLGDNATSLHCSIDAIFILSAAHGLIVHACTCHNVLLAVVCSELVLVRHELIAGIVLHASPVDLSDRGPSLTPIASLAMAALTVI